MPLSDIINLIAVGNPKLTYIVCDAEIDRLLRAKNHILHGVESPLLIGDVGFGLQNSLNPGVVRKEAIDVSTQPEWAAFAPAWGEVWVL